MWVCISNMDPPSSRCAVTLSILHACTSTSSTAQLSHSPRLLVSSSPRLLVSSPPPFPAPILSAAAQPRNLQKIKAYRRAQRLAPLWFAHSLTTVFLCTDVPRGGTPFLRRGWNAFEYACTWLLKPLDHKGEDVHWRRVIELTEADELDGGGGGGGGGQARVGERGSVCVYPTARPEPVGPEAFAGGGRSKFDVSILVFEHADDRELVTSSWRGTAQKGWDGSIRADYSDLGWGDTEAEALASVMPLCTNLEWLDLSRNGVVGGTSRGGGIRAGDGAVERDATFLTSTAADMTSVADKASLMRRTEEEAPKLGFTRLPESLCVAPRLRALFICSCAHLRTLPDSISNLTSLLSLFVSDCPSLIGLPDGIGALQHLQQIDASRCSAQSALCIAVPPAALNFLPSLGSRRFPALSNSILLGSLRGDVHHSVARFVA